MVGFAELKKPWVKVLKTARNEEKANKIAMEMRPKYGEVALLHPDQDNKEYRIAIFNEDMYAEVDKMDKLQGSRQKVCPICGKLDYQNRFFKCISCQSEECYACGSKRHFHDEVPLIHECGRDHFEFLGNIGSCPECHQPLNFKSIPQALRVRMMGRVIISRTLMMGQGILGSYNAEKLFLDKEITLSQAQLRMQITELHELASKGNVEAWIMKHDNCRATLRRIFWSADYIINVTDETLNQLQRNIYADISEKYAPWIPVLNMLATLHDGLSTSIRVGVEQPRFNGFISDYAKYIDRNRDLFPDNVIAALDVLKRLSNRIHDPSNFNEYGPAVETLLMMDIIDLMMNKHPSTLDC
jgi:hypothetical protein